MWVVHLNAGTSGRAQTPPTRVLVVDDSDPLVSLVKMWLDEEGYDVVTATSGRQALDAIAAYSPEIVLLDLIIPPPDGFVVCDVARRTPHPPEIVIMTGILDPRRLRLAEEAGIFTLLHKPLTQETVLDAVSRARRHRWEAARPAAEGAR